MSDTLHAWGRKIKDLEFLDHVFVTDYPSLDSAPSDGKFWYCWGKHYTDSRTELFNAKADIDLANKIMPSNEMAYSGEPDGKPAINMGAIVYYGLDGTCHQTVNEVLAVTGTSTAEPSRVKSCHGYPITTYFYGTYGTNTSDWDAIVSAHLSGKTLAGDDFLPLLAEHVPDDKQSKVKEMRATAQANLKAIRAKVVASQYNYYPEMQLANAEALAELHEYLGADTFKKLFPSLDFENIVWDALDWLSPPR